MKPLNDAELVRAFIEIARDYGTAIRNSDSATANELVPRFQAVQTALRARGADTQLKLVEPLVTSEDRLVRYYAAKEPFALCPEQARRIF